MKRTVAVALVGIGVLTLLSAIGILNPPIGWYWDTFWPGLLTLAGLEMLYRRFRRGKGDVLIPLVMIILGALLLLLNLHIFGLNIVNPWSLLFALFLIYIGISIFSSRSKRLFHVHVSGWPKKGKWSNFGNGWSDWGNWQKNGDVVIEPPDFGEGFANGKKHRVRMGEVRYGDIPWHLEPLLIENLAGSVRINLGTATIPEGETPIVVNGGVGEVRILVPTDLPVDVGVDAIGSEVRIFENRYTGLTLNGISHMDPGYDEAVRKVKIRIKLKFGEVRVKRGM